MRTAKRIEKLRALINKRIDDVLRREPNTQDRDLLLHISDSLLGEANTFFTPPRTSQTIHESQLIIEDALTHSENNC